MAGLAYYQQKPFFKKIWQRTVYGIVVMTTATLIGAWVDKLCEKRYSSFRGRTALYGSATVRNGWLDSSQKSNN